MSNSIWHKQNELRNSDIEKQKLVVLGKQSYCVCCVHPIFNILMADTSRCAFCNVQKWCDIDDLIAQADRADQLQAELDETKKALLRDFEIRNDCLTKILESYLNFAGLVRAYPNVPNLPTFRAGNIIYDWSPVLELMKNGHTDRALERLKAIEPDPICPKCGEKMLLSLPPQTQYKCWKCGYTETKGKNNE